MSTASRLTYDEYNLIREHNNSLKAGARKAIDKIRRMPRHERTDLENGMLDYWVHVVQCLTWSTKIAEQKAGLVDDGGYRANA
jgi:hypothetical protein